MDPCASSYRRFLCGDEKAFDEIMQALFHSLVFFLDRYVHDIQTAEDLAMDTMSDLIVHRHRYNFKVSLKTYLFMIGRCRALDYLRHTKVLSFTELPEADTLTDEETALEAIVLADERKKQLYAAMQTLPSEMQTVLSLVYFESMSYEETAKVMKKNKKQIDNLLFRAKKELREKLGKDGIVL